MRICDDTPFSNVVRIVRLTYLEKDANRILAFMQNGLSYDSAVCAVSKESEHEQGI